MKDPLKQTWFLLGQPWTHSNDAGFTILAGDEDPHIGRAIIECQDFSDDALDAETCRAIARHVVELHNKALEQQK